MDNKEKMKKLFEDKGEWEQEPYKDLEFLGINIWVLAAIGYIILWVFVFCIPIINQTLLPTWTKISVLIVSLGAGIPLIIAAYMVGIKKEVK